MIVSARLSALLTYTRLAAPAAVARFSSTATLLRAATAARLWSDGVHLSEHGDTLLHDLVDTHLREADTVDRLTTYPLAERDTALARYASLFNDVRDTPPATAC